jgi:diguanylate cyclase (GGDEF)-like protein/PAS domain S-box-containing protein
MALFLWWLLRPLSQLTDRARAFGRAGEQGADDGHEGDGHALRATAWPDGDDEIGRLSRTLREAMTARAQSEAAQAALAGRLASLMAAAPIGIAFSRAQRIEHAGREFEALLGYDTEHPIAGRPARDIFASEVEYDALGAKVGEAFAAGRPFFAEMQFRRRDGSVIWGRLQGRPVQPGHPDAGTVWLLEDVTTRRQERERLAWNASHDALTGLMNRAAFERQVVAAIDAGRAAALMAIDLDRFKAINDTGGHAAGDAVLRDVAALLQGQVRATDSVARVGGDEFAVLLVGCDEAVAMRIAEQVRAGAARVGIDHAGQRLTIGASIGVAMVEPGVPLAELFSRADRACYDAKRAGRGRVVGEARGAAPLRLVEGATG